MNISSIGNLKTHSKINPNKQSEFKSKKTQKDTFELSFKGLRKKDFDGLDLMIVELFKAPIELSHFI